MKGLIYKSILGLALVTVSITTFTSCIDENEPTEYATEKQASSSASSVKALLYGVSSYFNAEGTDNGNHYEYGYSSIMRIRDAETGDLPNVNSDYEWYSNWLCDKLLGSNNAFSRYVWKYYYAFIAKTNTLIASVDTTNASQEQLGCLGAGYAFRALIYSDMAPMYEFLSNDKTSSTNSDGHNVEGLTVPIVTDTTTEAGSRNNPRVSKAKMVAFILSDLKKAEKYIPYLQESDKILPHLSSVYGLEARVYLWNGDYANAEAAARKAIDASDVAPMDSAACLDTKKGFNQLDSWMWGSQQTSEDATVKTGIVNWTSFACNETEFGYNSAAGGPQTMIDKSMYDRINNTDWRKLEWVAPEGSALYGKNAYVDSTVFKGSIVDYGSLKFRPNEGNYEDYTKGAASAYPVMRVEEMYFIEAEAAAHLDAAKGKSLLESFMTTYRDPHYICKATTQDGIIDEIIFQKRVELWGEGRTFYDIKRLNYSVTRGYTGTNFYPTSCFNTNGRPAWMNFCIYRTEAENNTALAGWNNPDPSNAYTPWSE